MRGADRAGKMRAADCASTNKEEESAMAMTMTVSAPRAYRRAQVLSDEDGFTAARIWTAPQPRNAQHERAAFRRDLGRHNRDPAIGDRAPPCVMIRTVAAELTKAAAGRDFATLFIPQHPA